MWNSSKKKIFHIFTIFWFLWSTYSPSPEAEFLDVIWTKVLRVFLLAIHSHLYWQVLPLPPLGKSGLKLGCIVMKTSSLRTLKIMPRKTSTKLCVHEFVFRTVITVPLCTKINIIPVRLAIQENVKLRGSATDWLGHNCHLFFLHNRYGCGLWRGGEGRVKGDVMRGIIGGLLGWA